MMSSDELKDKRFYKLANQNLLDDIDNDNDDLRIDSIFQVKITYNNKNDRS